MKKISYLLFFLSTAYTAVSQRQIAVDSLMSRLEKTENDSARVNTLNALVLAMRMNEPEKSLEYIKESMALAEKINFKKGIGDAYHITGILYSNKGDYKKALENYFAALKLREEINDRNGIGTTNNNIGLVLWNQGKLEEALKHYLVSLKIDEEFGEKEGMATSYNNIGIIYWTLGSYDKALEYFIKTNTIYESLGHKEGLAGVYSNIGGIYFNKKNKEKALDYFHKSVSLYEELKDKRGMGSIYSNISEIYSENKEYREALDYQQKALKIQEEIGDKLHMIYSFSGIGKNYLSMNKASAAIAYLNKSVEMAMEIGVPKLRIDAYKMLAEAYKLNNDFQKASGYYEKYSSLKDSILNEDANRQVSEMEAKFQNEMKENKIELLHKENELKIVELHREKFVRNSFVAGFVLVLILSFAIYRSYRQKKKMNAMLTDKNSIIEQKNKDITDSIEYAKTLQDAILPDIETVTQSLPGSFIFFRPRDIVSGDFYWYHKKNSSASGAGNDGLETHFIIAADCTGHGVPGAFVSLACHNVLNDVIIHQKLEDPGEILTEVNKRVGEAFKKEGSKSRANDGMDVALIKIKIEKGKLNNPGIEYAGAMNPALVVRNKEVIELPANKMSIGGFTKSGYAFTTHRTALEKNDCLFIFSDGFHDQFGGVKGKKFMFRRFKETLVQMAELQPEQQMNQLEKVLSEWQGNHERVDDVLVIGVKV